jgi:ATP-binding cassette subfamily B protein
MTFERVLVIEDGTIAENGDPRVLARDPASRFHAMLKAERALREEFWDGADWRHLRLHNGHLTP